jgi:hypothetical protein
MAKKLDPSYLVKFKELVPASSIKTDTAVQIFIKKKLLK